MENGKIRAWSVLLIGILAITIAHNPTPIRAGDYGECTYGASVYGNCLLGTGGSSSATKKSTGGTSTPASSETSETGGESSSTEPTDPGSSNITDVQLPAEDEDADAPSTLWTYFYLILLVLGLTWLFYVIKQRRLNRAELSSPV